MATVDVSKLSLKDLNKLRESVEQTLAAKRQTALKELADRYITDSADAGFSTQEAIGALQPYWPKQRTAAAPSGRKYYKKDPNRVLPVPGTTYKHPTTGETWKRPESGKGRTIGWLQALVDAGGTFEQYAVKK